MTKRKIFVSYSHKDWDRVQPLLEELEQHQIDYWSADKLQAGEQWERALESALRSASVYVLFISANFLASKWAEYEMGFALGRVQNSEILIVPVLLSGAPTPNFMQKLKNVDLSALQPSEFVEKLEEIIDAA